MSELPIPAGQTAAAADAHAIEARIREQVDQLRKLWIELAADLHIFFEQELWQPLGYDSLSEWLGSPHIALERRWAFRLVAVYRELVVNREVEPSKLTPVSVSKLDEVLPAIRRGHKTVDEALADAEALGSADLRDRYRAMTVRPPNDPEPPIDGSDGPAYTTCPACGGRMEVRSS